MSTNTETRLALLNQFRKEFGETSMFLLGETDKLDIEVRPSGSLLLDLALGGGYPQGKAVELRGPERSGKTTLLNLFIAECQINEPEKECGIIDLENTWNPQWAETLGVNIDGLFVSQPDTYAEKVFQLLESMIKSGRFSVIGLDSIAGLVPKAEMEEEDYDKESRVGGNSKLIAKAIRKIINSGVLAASGTTLVFINQLRDKIGGFSPYGTPTTTGGGRALKHAMIQQLDVSIGEYFNKGTGDSKEVLGQKTKVKVAKNKIAAPFRTANLDLFYEHGLDRVTELVAVARKVNVLQGTSWLKFVDPRTGEIQLGADDAELKWNGKDKTRDAFNLDIEINNGEIYNRVFNMVNDVIRGVEV